MLELPASMEFNLIDDAGYVVGTGELTEEGLELGEDVTEIDAWQSAARRSFEERLWHDRDGLYYDYDLRVGALVRENTCTALSPLFAGLPSPDQARRLVEEHLLNPEEYAPGPGSRYYLPSASKASPHYEPRHYWRGPVWININWLIHQGLRRYGYDDLARTIRTQTLELVERGGFAEYYDPRDGAPLGAKGFSWSAALTLDLFAEAP